MFHNSAFICQTERDHIYQLELLVLTALNSSVTRGPYRQLDIDADVVSAFQPHEGSKVHKPDIVRHFSQARTGDALPREVRLEKVRHVGEDAAA
jgi:hypothetical protein